MMKRIISVVCAAVLCLAAFSGCSNDGKLTMATNAAFPPFEFVSNDNGLVDIFTGVDIAIAKAIADDMGKTLEVQNMEFEAVLMAVPQGTVDFAAAGITADDERRQSMDFSDTYYTATQYIIVRGDNTTINSAADLMTAAVGAIDGYTGFKQCMEMGIPNLTSFKQGVDAVNELKNGKLDAVVIDSHTALALIKVSGGLKYVTDNAIFGTEEYAIAVKKGNKEMLDQINKVLAKLIADGKIDEFVAQYTEEAGME